MKWLYETHRIRENILRGVAGYNVKEDPRHERRTVCLEELRKLIGVSEAGEPFKSMTGPMRSLSVHEETDAVMRMRPNNERAPGFMQSGRAAAEHQAVLKSRSALRPSQRRCRAVWPAAPALAAR